MMSTQVSQYTGDGDEIHVPISPPYCEQVPLPPRELPADLPQGRLSAILTVRSKRHGSPLHVLRQRTVVGAREPAVRDPQCIAEWKALGIGLEFKESDDLAESEIRIGYATDGSWSNVGRDVLGVATNQRTMSFGWDLTTPYGHSTARHEIGHTLGLEHEHQN